MEKEHKKEEEMNAVARIDPQKEAEQTALTVVPPVFPDANEPEMPLALVEKPKKNNYNRLRNWVVARRKNIDRKIIEVLERWSVNKLYPDTTGGMIINICDELEMSGCTIKAKAVRSHVVRLAQKNQLFCERMVFDPKRTYVPKRGQSPKGYFCEYYVALNDENGRRGLYEYVYHTTPNLDVLQKADKE